MIYFDRIEVFEGVDVNKTSVSKECDICHYWCFLNYNFKFQPNACNRGHDLLIMLMNFSDAAILNIKSSDYRSISLISKNEAIKLNAKCRFDRKKRNIIKLIQFIFIYKNG